MSLTPKLSKNSSFAINLIRFIAAELVVIGHGLWDFKFAGTYFKWFPLQDFAVLIFFILSGFLISFSVILKMKDKSYSFKEYFIDRFSRIYSALIPCLLIIAILDIVYIYFINNCETDFYTLNVKTFIGNVFMLQDYPLLLHLKYYLMASKNSILYISSFGSGRPLWSLAVEWWMYMSFGWLFLKNSSKNKFFYYTVLIILSVVPVYNLFSGSKTEGLAVVWLMGCMITLMLSYDMYKLKNINSAFLSALFAGLAFITAVHFISGYNILTAILFTLSFYFLIIHTNESSYKIPIPFQKIVKFGAGYSFTLYLLHYSVLQYLLVYPHQYSVTTRFWLYFFIANVIALLVALVTEMRYKQFSNYLKNKTI